MLGENSMSLGVLIALTVGITALTLLIVFVGFRVFRHYSRKDHQRRDIEPPL